MTDPLAFCSAQSLGTLLHPRSRYTERQFNTIGRGYKCPVRALNTSLISFLISRKMLPVESLRDVIALFKCFELGSLLLTNQRFSIVARQAASKIRLSDFSDISFDLFGNQGISIFVGRPYQVILSEAFADESVMCKFVSEAFRLCVFGNLQLIWCPASVLCALKEAAKTVIVTGMLVIIHSPLVIEQVVVDVVGAFQRVEVSTFAFAQFCYCCAFCPPSYDLWSEGRQKTRDYF